MKMYFSKLAKVLLAGAAIVAVGCTDYKDDIASINDKLDNDIVAGMIEPLQADLEKAVADLEAAQAALKAELTTKHDADVKTLQDADAALDGKIAAANKSIVDLQAALAAEKAALQAEIDALEVALEAAKKAAADADAALKAELVKEITDLETELLAKITALETKHNEEIAALAKKVDDNKAAVDAEFAKVAGQISDLNDKDAELEAELAKQAKAIEDLDAKVDANYAELSATIEAVRKNLQDQVYANKAAIDANKASINAVAAGLATLTADVRALEQKVYGIEGDLVAHLEEYANYKALVAGKLEALEAAHAALEARVADLENVVIPAIKAQIAENAKLANANAAEIAKNAALFEQYKQAAQQTYAALVAADEDLALSIALLGEQVDGIAADLAAYKATIEDELADHYDAFEQFKNDTDERISDAVAKELAHYTELTAKHNAQEAALAQLQAFLQQEIAERKAADAALQASIESLNIRLDAVTARVAVLEAGLADLKAAHEALANEYAAFKKEITTSLINAINALQEQMVLNNAAIYGTIAELQAHVDAEVAALKKADENLQNAINAEKKAREEAIAAEKKAREDADAALQEQIDAIVANLAAMVQSLVYVPEYTDGMATIEYATIGSQTETILEGYSQITYQVYPAECAATIAALPNAAELFSFDSKTVAIRPMGWTEDVLTVVKVDADAEKAGALVLTVKANLGENFYQGEEQHAVSLHLNVADTNLSSCYTNLIAANTAAHIRTNIYVNNIDWTPANGNYSLPFEGAAADIEYIDLKKTVEIAPDHVIGYTVPGEEKPLTAAEVAEKYGYEVTYQAEQPVVEYIQGEETTELEKVYELVAQEPRHEWTNAWTSIKLQKEDKKAVGSSCVVKYFYNVYGDTLSIGGRANIIPIQTKVTLDAVNPVVWNYVADAEQDAVALNGGDANYARTAIKLALTSSELPEDTTVADLILSGAPDKTEVIVNGAAVSGVTATLNGNETDGYTLALSNFEWDTEYTVALKYALAHLDANVTIKVNTVDRKRGELVKVEQTYDNYVFAKDYAFAAFDGVAPEMAINSVYTDVAALYDLTGIEEAAYLKEVFVEKTPYAVADVVAPTATLDYLFNAEGNAVSVAYAYDAWAQPALNVTYTKNITLWYGQDVELVVNLVLALPKYDFAPAGHYTKLNPDANRLESKVFPYYLPKLSELEAIAGNPLKFFDVDKVDMDKAFDIVDEAGSRIVFDIDMTDIELYKEKLLNVYGLLPVFELEKDYNADFKAYNDEVDVDTNVDPTDRLAYHRRIDMNNNKIDYYGPNKYVDVRGRLYIVNSNGSKVELPTSFDNVPDFVNYAVKKYDPIDWGRKKVDEVVRVVKLDPIAVSSATNYDERVLQHVELKDWRDNYTNYSLVDPATQDWVKGNDENGFASSVNNVSKLYRLRKKWTTSVVADPELRKILKFDATEGILTLNNEAHIELTEPVPFIVTLELQSCWGDYKYEIHYTFEQKHGDAVNE